MIKKFKIELLILVVLFINILVSNNIDVKIDKFSTSFQNIYLLNFFKQITVLGDSKWYFCILLLIIIFYNFIKKINYYNNYKNIIGVYNNFSIYLGLSLIITGLLTQLLKHVIGGPRPNYASLDDIFQFKFFNLNSEFHSFPSGHTSTIFAVALVTAMFLPNIKYFFIVLAGVIAFSRIVVGAHFFTDVIGGITISYIGVKLTKLFLDKHFPDITNQQINLFLNNKFYFSLVILLFFAVFLSVGSSFDIYISSLFYFGNNQFFLQSYDYTTIFVRKIILPVIIIYIFVLPIFSIFLPLKQLYFKFEFKFRDIIFLWGVGIFNLGIIVNLFFKTIWGRARPGGILEFGGREDFTPWFKISDACANNCAFFSGDAAVGFSVIVFYFFTRKIVFFWLSLLFGFGIGLVRIMEGGHFVSDVVMAALVLYLVFYFQAKYYFNKYD